MSAYKLGYRLGLRLAGVVWAIKPLRPLLVSRIFKNFKAAERSGPNSGYMLKAACSHCGRYGTVDDCSLICSRCGKAHCITQAELRQRDEDMALWSHWAGRA